VGGKERAVLLMAQSSPVVHLGVVRMMTLLFGGGLSTIYRQRYAAIVQSSMGVDWAGGGRLTLD
jgi:hypothetical protein